MLSSLQPGGHLLRCEHVRLPANRQRTFEDVEHFLESERVSETMSEAAVDMVLAFPLNLWRNHVDALPGSRLRP